MNKNLDYSDVAVKCYKLSVRNFLTSSAKVVMMFCWSLSGLSMVSAHARLFFKWGTLLDICSDDPLEYYPESGKVCLPMLYVDFVNY